MSFTIPSVARASFAHVLKADVTLGTLSTMNQVHILEFPRPDTGTALVDFRCPTCDQHFRILVRSVQLTSRRRLTLLASGIALAALIALATQVEAVPMVAKGFLVAIVGIFVALPLLIAGLAGVTGLSGLRRIAPDGRTLPDLGGHRLMS